jgi:cell division transport system ATP-binding protein
VIHLDNVTKAYSRSGPAVKDMTFTVRKGEFVFLTGHSGSGKSTTLKLIHMSERPTQGEVRVSGYSSSLIADRDLWKVRRRVGCVFQDFRLLPGRTALENVAFALEVTGAPSALVRSKSQRLLAQVGLSAKTSALNTELSGGEQQRVAVARSLVNDPIVLLADEPTGNLDERATRAGVELFWEINALGMAVLMATHDLELIRRYPAARVLELSQGRLVYDSAATPAASAGAGR